MQDTQLQQMAEYLLQTQLMLHQSAAWILACANMLEGDSPQDTVVELLHHLSYISDGMADGLVQPTKDRIHCALSHRMELQKEVCAKADPMAKASVLSAAPFLPILLDVQALGLKRLALSRLT